MQAFQTRDPAMLAGMWTELQRRIVTQTCAGGFHIVSLMCLGGAALAFLLSTGRPRHDDEPEARYVPEA